MKGYSLIALLIDQDLQFSKELKDFLRTNQKQKVSLIKTVADCNEAMEFTGSLEIDVLIAAEKYINDIKTFQDIVYKCRIKKIVILFEPGYDERNYPPSLIRMISMVYKKASLLEIHDAILENPSTEAASKAKTTTAVEAASKAEAAVTADAVDYKQAFEEQSAVLEQEAVNIFGAGNINDTDNKIDDDISARGAGVKPKSMVITVYSPQGGSGKTTISLNMAMHYAAKGLKVLFVDFALFGGINTFVNKPVSGKGMNLLLEILKQDELIFMSDHCNSYIKDAAYSYMYPNLDVILADNPVNMEGIKLSQADNLIWAFRKCGYDVVIIDTSVELSERNIACIIKSDFVLIVLTPDISAGWKMMQIKEQVFSRLGIEDKKINIAVNRHIKAAAGIPAEFEKILNYTVIDTIPDYYRELISSTNDSRCIAMKSSSPVNNHIKKIAARYINVFTPDDLKPRRDYLWLLNWF